MALTFPLSIPDYEHIQEMRIETVNAVSRNVSPYTFQTQVQAYSGVARLFRFQLRPLYKDEAGQWLAWLDALNGGAELCLIGDAHNRDPQGSASTTPGAPLVAGGSQTGLELDVDGLPLSTNGYLLAGDWIQLGSGEDARIYRITADVNTDGAGAATFDIFPALRTSPANDSAVIVSDTVCAARLVDNAWQYEVNRDHLHDIEFQVMEAL